MQSEIYISICLLILFVVKGCILWWPSGTVSWSLGLLVSLIILAISPSLHLSISWPYSRYLSLSPSINPDWSKYIMTFHWLKNMFKCWLVKKSACIWGHTKSNTWFSTVFNITDPRTRDHVHRKPLFYVNYVYLSLCMKESIKNVMILLNQG